MPSNFPLGASLNGLQEKMLVDFREASRPKLDLIL